MPRSSHAARIPRWTSPSGLAVELNHNGSIRRIDCDGIVVNLFLGNALEGGPANLTLRLRGGGTAPGAATPLLGPRSPSRFRLDPAAGPPLAQGEWGGLRYELALRLAAASPALLWRLALENVAAEPVTLDVVHALDLGLAPYGALRLNEYYVSQYVDHTPLLHQRHGWVLASRQNQAAAGRHPWCLSGSLRRAVSYASDALQWRDPAADLPGRRLQHEHSMALLQDEPLTLAPGERARLGFYVALQADHPAATSADDLDVVQQVLALPEAQPGDWPAAGDASPAAASLFSAAPPLAARELDDAELSAAFGPGRRHEERDPQGRLLSFFHAEHSHVALPAKERGLLRPHGHLLRSGRHLTPDETALTSTVWMAGVFHSMLTQGHVSINRLLSTTRSYLGLFRSHGLRVFVEIDGAWRLLEQPSAFEIAPQACRWLYRHAAGTIEVRSMAHDEPQRMSLAIEVREGPPLRCLISQHVALNGDDGAAPGRARWSLDGDAVVLAPAVGSELRRRFPGGSFHIEPAEGTRFERIGGDELLFLDGAERGEPYLCIVTVPAVSIGLQLVGRLLEAPAPAAGELLPPLRFEPPAASPLAGALAQLAEIVPWFAHNAAVHYLSPRGLEQYSGGGWGTRDVCQGPLELLLALDRTAPIRDLLLRVMQAQNRDGDWPQWFMFFERERHIRAGDSHGDIVFWPLLALAQYLLASGDAALLDEPVPYHGRRAPRGSAPTVWQHVQRALGLIRRRIIGGTALAAYGHGDWNDALQPADPALREHMCSAWTVTLHYQTLTTLARALRGCGKARDAARCEREAKAVQADFRRLLLADGVLAGYALFEPDRQLSPGRSEDSCPPPRGADAVLRGRGPTSPPRLLLHPRDQRTGVRYSALAMIHAVLEDMLTPQEARAHLQLIERHLKGPDGLRLFDQPLAYHGGPQRLFQRAESASFFGREIGLMYMHAHLRYAQALAHVGEAEAFFEALCQANPIGLPERVASAARRQSNCYYSSSDAAFADRAEASAQYQRIADGTVALEGGWRVYSSGAGIALGLIVRRLLGFSREGDVLCVDPVLPAALDGLRVTTTLAGRPLEVSYRVSGRGCGVTALELDGRDLPFERAPNPHRPGAACVPVAHVASAGRLLVSVGGG